MYSNNHEILTTLNLLFYFRELTLNYPKKIIKKKKKKNLSYTLYYFIHNILSISMIVNYIYIYFY